MEQDAFFLLKSTNHINNKFKVKLFLAINHVRRQIKKNLILFLIINQIIVLSYII